MKMALACLAAMPVLLAAKEPLRLTPSSSWVLDYAANSCRLTRTFGDPANRTVLLFERASPISQISMVTIGSPLKTLSPDLVTAKFLPGDALSFTGGQPGKSAAGKDPAVLWSGVGFLTHADMEPAIESQKIINKGGRPAPIDLAKIAVLHSQRDANAVKVTAIEILARRNQSVVLATGSLGRPIRMLGDCARSQLRNWGVDPEVEDKIVLRPWAPLPGSWFTSDDYPMSKLMRNQESVVEARLLIDATGKITRCTALSHVDAPEFTKVVCNALTTRGEFQPAELTDGTKVASYFILTTRFRLP